MRTVNHEKDAEAHAEGEAGGPGRREHEQPVPDEEGDEECPVHEKRGVRGALQQAREDGKPQAALPGAAQPAAE